MEIILLDKVQKGNPINNSEIKHLRRNGLIEGRKPNFHISENVAGKTDQKASYLKLKGIDDDYYKKMIFDYLKRFGEGKKSDFDDLLLDKLPEALNKHQRQNKIKNLLQNLKQSGDIMVKGKKWTLPNRR